MLNKIDFIFSKHNIQNNQNDIIDILKNEHEIGYDEDFLFEFAKKIYKKTKSFSVDYPVFDICGTGGSGKNRINLSTGISFLMSKYFKIAKHGNFSSNPAKFGGFDMLKMINFNHCSSKNEAITSLKENNLAFLLALDFNLNLGDFREIRAKINHATAFNWVMPILNPVKNLKCQMIGVSCEKMTRKMSKIALKLNKNCIFVHDLDNNLDDVSITGKTLISVVDNGIIYEKIIKPQDFGFDRIDCFEKISTNGSIESSKDAFFAVKNLDIDIKNESIKVFVKDENKSIKNIDEICSFAGINIAVAVSFFKI